MDIICATHEPDIFVHRHILVIWNICMPVLLVTLLTVLSSYEVYVLK